jgi:hypothetical protein
MSTLRKQVLDDLKKRRERIVNGYVNSIPSPFKRFSNDYVGLEQDTYICVTSFTKGGKSQFVSYTMIYHSLLYAYLNPEKNIDITFLYFALEETKERVMQRFMSYLLYEKNQGKIRISPKQLRSTQEAVDEQAFQLLESKEYDDIIKYFEDHIIFSTESNPTGIMKFCKRYAETVGTTNKKQYEVYDENGIAETRELFESYTLNNPYKYIVPIIDTINFIDTEKGLTMKQSMDKMSEYCAKILRNRYHMTPIVIQQQAFEVEKIDEFKLKQGNIRPSVAGLGDSKYVSRDANLVLGLFSPARFGIKKYNGYNIEILEDNIRFLEVCVARDGEMGGMVALYFDGACSYFKELPPAEKVNQYGNKEETKEIKAIYSWVQGQREKSNKTFYIRTIKGIFDKVKQRSNRLMSHFIY